MHISAIYHLAPMKVHIGCTGTVAHIVYIYTMCIYTMPDMDVNKIAIGNLLLHVGSNVGI